MAERLKDIYFTDTSLARIAELVAEASPSFDPGRFLALVRDDAWSGLELKGRLRHVAESLEPLLPDYPHALDVLRAVAPQIEGFEALVPAEYVLRFGQDPDHWDRSLDALAFFTRYGSAEFAIRPFLQRDPVRALEHVQRWARDEHAAVRRLASEGCRPRLPWAAPLRRFQQDPRPILPVLETLRDDPSEMVRRSVANALNDISKDHPALMLDVCERWAGTSPRADEIVRHACRTLLKAGDPRALRLFGLDDASGLAVEGLAVEPREIAIGDSLRLSCTLRVDPPGARRARVDYVIDFVKARGSRSPKTFRLAEKDFGPGEHRLTRKHSFRDLSTRTHYPGQHGLAVVVNGVEMARLEFTVTAPSR